jgi:hypothetical protein
LTDRADNLPVQLSGRRFLCSLHLFGNSDWSGRRVADCTVSRSIPRVVTEPMEMSWFPAVSELWQIGSRYNINSERV